MAEDTATTYWKPICQTLLKEGAIVELEYGDVHNKTVGSIGKVVPGGIEFTEAGGRQLFLPFNRIDAMRRLPLAQTEETEETKRKGAAGGR